MANCLPFKLFNALRPVTTTYVKYWNQIMFNGRLIMMTRDFSEAKQSSDSESKPPQNNSSDGNTYNCKEYFSYSMFFLIMTLMQNVLINAFLNQKLILKKLMLK